MAATQADLFNEVNASVDWEKAIAAGLIEDVEVDVIEHAPTRKFAAGSPCGTELTLTGLTHNWDATAFRDLARELWPLQPPFAAKSAEENVFQVNLHSPYEEVVREFNSQMRAILDIWAWRVTGRLLRPEAAAPTEPVYELMNDQQSNDQTSRAGHGPRLLHVTAEERRGSRRELTFLISNCHLDRLSYEIRVFDLRNRQPRGVKVDTARDYMLAYGGVHIYDENFHLPYYGPDNDWLKIERDSARRISASRLLPKELQVQRGMLDLVPNTRLYGAVQISTTHEAEQGGSEISIRDILTVQITRDRLVDNTAFDDLRRLVRVGMDLYAMEVARAKFERSRQRRSKITRPPSTRIREVEENFNSLGDVIPDSHQETFEKIREEFADAVADSEALERAVLTRTSLLAGLATAGITTIAYDHEMSKQIATLTSLGRQVSTLAVDAPQALRDQLRSIAQKLNDLGQRSSRIRQIFLPITDEELRTSEDAGTIYDMVNDLDESLQVLARGSDIDYSRVPHAMRFPPGGYIAWWSMLQNLFVNSFNALLDSERKLIRVDASGSDHAGWIRVQDTGVGIDLADAERMFEPFERGLPPSREKADLVLGGTGLGLTIVRLVSDELGVGVAFDPPDDGFSTSVRIFWGGQK
jgi:signal transduction histidine kinase